MTGFEALLRWKHPARGEISPAVFIPIAEESGAILEIGEWVLRTACREAASWEQPLTVAVNVSAVQLYNPDFVQELHQILLETGLSPKRLEIEITETALVRDFNRALTTLRQIKALGVRIAMDDFGTGYSSLSNLRAFPFDKIKIDGSFIKSVNSNGQAATIVRAVLGLGRGLGSAGTGRRRRDRRRAAVPARRDPATKCRAICSDARPRSTVSAISPTPRLLPTTNRRNCLCLAQKAPEKVSQAPSREAVTGSSQPWPQVKVWVFAIEIRVTTTAFIKPPR